MSLCWLRLSCTNAHRSTWYSTCTCYGCFVVQDSDTLFTSVSLNINKVRLCIHTALFGSAASCMPCKLGLFLPFPHLSNAPREHFLAAQCFLRPQSASIHLVSPPLSCRISLFRMATSRLCGLIRSRTWQVAFSVTLHAFIFSKGRASLYLSVRRSAWLWGFLPACTRPLQRERNLGQLSSV